MTYRVSMRILVTTATTLWIAGACSSTPTEPSGAGGNGPSASGGTANGAAGGSPDQGAGGTGAASSSTSAAGGNPASGGRTASTVQTSTGGKLTTGGVTGASGATGGITGASGTTSAGGTLSSSTSGSGGTTSSSSTGSSSPSSNTTGPCDIYAAASLPCVAAYSTVRVLLSTYTGPLYQVRKGGTNNVFKGNQAVGTVGGTSGGTTQDIGATADGFADSAAQDTFCGTSTCSFSVLYDQSGQGNNLTQAPAGSYEPGPDYEVPASHSVTVGGHKVYSVYFPNPPSLPSGSAPSGYGYRNDKTKGVPTGTAAQGVYMLADGTHAGSACCFDFGNAETNNGNGPAGEMAALNLGTSYWGQGAGSAPWFEADFEDGVWAGGFRAAPRARASSPVVGGRPIPRIPR